MRRLLLLLTLSCSAIAPACATTGEAERPAPAELEVLNRTEVDLWIDVRGRVEGTAVAGGRLRIRNLVPGEAELKAQPTPEARAGLRLAEGADTFGKTLTLEAGHRATWAIGNQGPVPKELGSVVIDNRIPRDMTVEVDGRVLGIVLAGDSRRFDDLPVGAHSFKATDRARRTVLDKDLLVQETPNATWKLEVASAKLTIINDTEEAVELEADGKDIGVLPSGDRRELTGLGVGDHEIIAVSQVTGRRYQRVIELSSDFPQVWGLASGSATLILDNQTGENLMAVPTGNLVASAARTFEIPAGAKIKVEEVVPGRVGLNAVSDKTSTLYKMEVDLRVGQAYTWVARPASTTVRVVNATGEKLTLYIDGTRQQAVRPGSSAVLSDLPHEAFKLEAYDDFGHRYLLSVPDGPRTASTWTVRPVTGTLEVRNDRPEVVDVYMDAELLGQVDPERTVRFTGVPVGRRVVEALGEKTGTRLSEKALVAKDAVTPIVLADPRGLVTVENRTGETLVVQGGIAEQQRLLLDGARAHFAVPVGRIVLRFVGRDSELAYGRQLDVVAGQPREWTIGPPRGHLRVVNDTEEPLAVRVDGAGLGTIAPGTSSLLGPLDAGVHRVQVQGMTSGRLKAVKRMVPVDGEARWRVAIEEARLSVRNHTQEPVQIAIDGRPWGVVMPGVPKIFADLARGRHEVVAVGRTSRVQQRYSVALEAGRTDVLELMPAFGTVLIDNQSGETVQVRAAGEVVGRIEAGRPPTPVPVPAGMQMIRVERVDSAVPSVYRMDIEANRSVELIVSGVKSRVAVKNETQTSLTIKIGDRTVGVVPPGGSLVAVDLPVGKTKMRAIDDEGRVTHQEIRDLDPAQLGTWILR